MLNVVFQTHTTHLGSMVLFVYINEVLFFNLLRNRPVPVSTPPSAPFILSQASRLHSLLAFAYRRPTRRRAWVRRH